MSKPLLKHPAKKAPAHKEPRHRVAGGKWDRRKSARDLRDSEGRFRAVIEQSIAAIYVIQDRRIVYVNPRMRQLFGYAPGEMFDPNPLAHVKETDWLKVIEQMQRRTKGEGEGIYTITALHKDGSEFPFGIHATQAVYEGKPAIIAVAQDISDKVRAEEDTRRYIERLKQGMHSTVEVISIISEMRDPYTHGHERRVGEIAAAAAIAVEMGLDANRVEGIRVAGYMHDVGKIGVPAEILSKPTRLTPAEFQLVRGHAQQSYEILKGVDFPWPVAQVALQHHERLDGSGYPQGLKGDEILLEARIIAVADVVEAMASHRPYRPGLGIDHALAEIERGRGTVYDPVVSDACLRLFRDRGYAIPA
jgi:PAS domain S-box-containing protein